MRNIFLSLLFFLLMIYSCSDKGIFSNQYRFSECFGETAGGSQMCYEFTVKFFKENKAQKAEYNIDGFQTMKRFICDVESEGNVHKFYFDKHGEDDMFKSNRQQKGQFLFKIIEKGNKVYISHFNSPVSGQLITKEYELQCVQNNLHGNFACRNKDTRIGVRP